MSKGWAGGSTRRWRKIRAWILVRDRHLCQVRLPCCTTIATCVHHLHGRSRCPGCKADQADHLVAACRDCNLSTGDPGRTQVRNPKPKPMTRW